MEKTKSCGWCSGSFQHAFTLVELLVVISIIGVLVTITAVTFRSPQLKGRDTRRKNDLKQVANALALFYNDYGKYPDSSSGLIKACPYNPTTKTGTACAWGSGEFTDGNTIYFKTMPKDPSTSFNYYYAVVPSSNYQKFQLFAKLENPNDPNCLGGNCASPPQLPTGVICGGASDKCNFSVTSANTTPTEPTPGP